MTPMTDNGLAALAQCGFVCGIPKDAHQTEEHPWEPLHHVAVGCPDAATIAALRTALEEARLWLMEDVDPDAVITAIDAALATAKEAGR